MSVDGCGLDGGGGGVQKRIVEIGCSRAAMLLGLRVWFGVG